MDARTTDYFAGIVDSAQELFTQVEYSVDATPQRMILRLQAHYKHFEISLTELIADKQRKYRYYVLSKDKVIVGFDNSPDPQAVRLKFGRMGSFAGSLVPHVHLDNKRTIELTDEMTFPMFIEWLEVHLDPT